MKFNMSQAWNEAMAMFNANREVLFVVAGIFFFLPSVLTAMVMPNFQEELLTNPTALEAQMTALYASWGWLLVLLSLASIVGNLALLALLRDHARPTVSEALRAGLKGMLPAIATYILIGMGLAVVLGVLFAVAFAAGDAGSGSVVGLLLAVVCAVLFIYAMVKLSLVSPVIALDKVHNPLKVMARSWQLTKGNSFRLFLFYALLFICYLVISMVVGIPLGLLGLATGSTVGLFINGVVGGAISAVVTVVFIAILASVHRQLSGPSAASVSETFE